MVIHGNLNQNASLDYFFPLHFAANLRFRRGCKQTSMFRSVVHSLGSSSSASASLQLSTSQTIDSGPARYNLGFESTMYCHDRAHSSRRLWRLRPSTAFAWRRRSGRRKSHRFMHCWPLLGQEASWSVICRHRNMLRV